MFKKRCIMFKKELSIKCYEQQQFQGFHLHAVLCLQLEPEELNSE